MIGTLMEIWPVPPPPALVEVLPGGREIGDNDEDRVSLGRGVSGITGPVDEGYVAVVSDPIVTGTGMLGSVSVGVGGLAPVPVPGPVGIVPLLTGKGADVSGPVPLASGEIPLVGVEKEVAVIAVFGLGPVLVLVSDWFSP